MRVTRETLKPVASCVAIALSIFQIWFTAGFDVMDAPMLRAIHLGAVMALIFLWFPAVKPTPGEVENPLWLVLDFVLIGISIAVAYYLVSQIDYILTRIRYVDPVSMEDMVYGTICILLVLEVTRRTSGWALVTVSSCFLLYAVWGNYLPSSIGHAGVTYEMLIEQLYLLTDGVYGIPIAVASTMIFAFVMFGAFLECSGLSRVFMELACVLTRKSAGGPAKVAIFASALFGTISGSAAANVYGTGTFTIPLMKRVGYSGPFAGAVEAVASTGGQLMPPIMGAAAFVMADVTGAGYLAVAKAAVLPSILYYLSLFCMIHFEAVGKGVGRMPADMIPPTREVLGRLYYIAPILILIGFLISGRSAISAAFLGTLSVVLVAAFRKETRFTPTRLRLALEMSARNALMISACCACAGIVVGIMALTGVGYKFINVITSLGGDYLLLMMVLLMVTCIILGMGVPTTPAYVIVATLGAPALMKMGVPIMAAHMFVLYFAILSVITPPVCLASYAGAAIAEANAMRTGYVAVKLGIVAFIIPYMFVFEPALLLEGSLSTVIWAVITAITGVVGLAAGLQGWFLTQCRIHERFFLGIGGLTLIYPGLITDTIGFSLITLASLLQLYRRRVSAAPLPVVIE